MLGISEEHVLEHERGDRVAPEYDDADAVTLAHNHTDPTVITDGIDRVTVVPESGETYLVDYLGYRAGYLRVDRDGVAELGAALLGERGEVPAWIVRDVADLASRPWWFPDDWDGNGSVRCQHCGSDTPAGDVLTPGAYDDADPDRYCRDCWEDVREEWHRQWEADR